jgi:hypothetical protein
MDLAPFTPWIYNYANQTTEMYEATAGGKETRKRKEITNGEKDEEHE